MLLVFLTESGAYLSICVFRNRQIPIKVPLNYKTVVSSKYMLTMLAGSTLALISQATAMAEGQDQAGVAVNLADIKSIIVNPDQKTVTLSLSTQQDYQNAAGETGVSLLEPRHLTMVSTTGGFKVEVRASQDLTNQAAATVLSVDHVYIKASNAVQVAEDEAAPVINGAALSSQGIQLQNGNVGDILTSSHSNGGTLGTTVDIQYTIRNVQNVTSLPSGSYETLLTYTIEGN